MEKILDGLNMLWSTWNMCKKDGIKIEYRLLQIDILNAMKNYLKTAIKTKKEISKSSRFLINDMMREKSVFRGKCKDYFVLKALMKMVLRKQQRKKIRVGVVTIYDLNNYGNRLQNYAVIQYLEELGLVADTLIINQWNKRKIIRYIKSLVERKEMYKHWNLRQEDKKRVALLSPIQKKRYELFKQFSYKYTNIKKVCYWEEFPNFLDKKYDYFITGSDQVWNPTIGQAKEWEFLSFAKKNKKISWAASFGISNIPDAYVDRISKGLSGMKSISVREDSGVDIVKKIADQDAALLLDPTMVISVSEWEKLAKAPSEDLSQPYIFTYFLGELDKEAEAQIRKISQENKLQIWNLLDEKNETLYTTGPLEFLYCIKEAELVCTDSFHACVFSILFNKPFLVFERKGKEQAMGSRIKTLLSKLKLEDRMPGCVEETNIFDHNYEVAYSIIEEERRKTRDYLERAMDLKDI